MFGISGSEFLVIILVAVLVVGPQRLPEYTRKLTQLVRQLRVFLDNARSQIAEEVGPEMADLDLSSLDPRQYDPRKIVRDALGEDIDAIREDLAHPFRSVGSAAKELSDDAAQAVNDVVKQDRANSLSKQIEAKRAEQLAEKNTAGNADDGAGAEDEASAETTAEKDTETTDVTEAAENVSAVESSQPSEPSAPPRGVLQRTGNGESEDEPVESTDQDAGRADEAESAEQPEKTEAEQTQEPESVEEPAESAPVEVPTSLVEPDANAAGAEPTDSSQEDEDSATRVRPLSPRDIVRAANAAARTRAEAARVVVDF